MIVVAHYCGNKRKTYLNKYVVTNEILKMEDDSDQHESVQSFTTFLWKKNEMKRKSGMPNRSNNNRI